MSGNKKNADAVRLGQLRKKKTEEGGLPSYAEIGRLGGQARAKGMTDEEKKTLAAQASKGGKAGSAARAAALTPARRSEIAAKAAAARWGKKATQGRGGNKEKSD